MGRCETIDWGIAREGLDISVDHSARGRTRRQRSPAEVLRLVDTDPGLARREATRLLSRALVDERYADASVLARAAGLAATHVTDVETGIRFARAAVDYARRAKRTSLTGEAQMSLAAILLRQGNRRTAIRMINSAVDTLHGVARARARAQRAGIRQQIGQLDDALADYRVALPTLRRSADWTWVQRVLGNRAILYIYRSQLNAAAGDLSEAEQVCVDHNLDHLQLALVYDNVGFLNLRRGDVPTALRAFDAAEAKYIEVGAHPGTVLVDRAELLLSVRLVAEARDNAARAATEFQSLHRDIWLPQAQLLLAETALLDNDVGPALTAAQAALTRFRRQERAEWVALARFAVLRCRLAAAHGRRPTADAAAKVAADLEQHGWTVPAQDAYILAARIALDRNQVRDAERLLHDAASWRRRGTAEIRSRGWHAEALLRLAGGHRRDAAAALQAGIRVLDDHQLTLGAADLRTHVSGHRQALVDLGLRLALESHHARRVFTWAEHGRASALRLRPARPPQDPELAQLLVELRGVTADIDELQRAGRDTAHAVRRQAAMERRVRDRARFVPGAYAHAQQPDVAELATTLGDRALVEYAVSDGQLYALTIVDGTVRLTTLGPADRAAKLAQYLTFALRRMNIGPRADRRRSNSEYGARQRLQRIAQELDDAVLRPIESLIGDRPLVISPTGFLQSLNWPLLASCAGRSVTIAPSAGLWYQANQVTAHAGGVTAVAGPNLQVSEPEATAVAGLYADADLLVGVDASVQAVMTALGASRVVHVAAHGNFRSDNPLFSSLRLADGPLTVYDLDSLAQAPQVVVLAACEGGSAAVSVGDELLGLATGFLGLGTNVLVAPTGPVSDEDVAPLMIDLHRQFQAGSSVADALAAVQMSAANATDRTFAAAASLTCFGAGHAVHGVLADSSSADGSARRRDR